MQLVNNDALVNRYTSPRVNVDAELDALLDVVNDTAQHDRFLLDIAAQHLAVAAEVRYVNRFLDTLTDVRDQ